MPFRQHHATGLWAHYEAVPGDTQGEWIGRWRVHKPDARDAGQPSIRVHHSGQTEPVADARRAEQKALDAAFDWIEQGT